MNILRNIFSTRTLSFLRQNGQNALYNLTNENSTNSSINDNDKGTGLIARLCPQSLPGSGSHKNEENLLSSSSTILNQFLNEPTLVTDNQNVPLKSTIAVHIPLKKIQDYNYPINISPRTLELCRQMQRKLTIIYRCKLCNTRNSKQVNASAYQSGVVILQCDGCAVNHVIIDHLGWFIDSKGKTFQDVINDHSSNDRPIKVIRINENDEII